MDAKRAASKSWERLVRAGTWGVEDAAEHVGDAWGERVEDGRVRYAMAGLGLGPLVGSLLAAVGDHAAPMYGTGWLVAPISSLGIVVGLCLPVMAFISASWGDDYWASRRRRVSARIRTKATEDPEFREQLKADPRRTFEREFRFTTSDDFEITVLEERQSTHTSCSSDPMGRGLLWLSRVRQAAAGRRAAASR